MDYKRSYNVSGGKLAAGIVMALIVGTIAPMAMVLEMSLCVAMPVILLSGLFMVFLYCFAGRIPAMLFMISQLTSTAMALNATFMWMSMLAGTLPAVLTVRGIAFKRPFFEQLRSAVQASMVGLVAAVFVAFSQYGGNMIGRLTEFMRSQFTLMPDEVFAPFVETINATIARSGLTGVRPYTVESYRGQLAGILSMLGDAYAQTMPGALLNGAMLTGVLSVLWGNWLCARHGLASTESFVSIERWHLPSQATFGLTLIWLISYVMSETGYSSGDIVYTAVYYIISSAFAFQGIAVVNRFFARRGTSAGRRTVITVVLILFGQVVRLLNDVLFIIGTLSAMFGSMGAVRRKANRTNDDQSDEDDRDQ